MYLSCNFKRFLGLLMLDALIFVISSAFFFIGRSLLFSSADDSEERGVFLPVIMYHSVHEGAPQDYVVTPSQFEDDLNWLAENGYSSVTAQELVDYTLGKGDLPEKPVLITFDDGFYNNLSLALPLLEKYDMQAIVSIVGKFTDDYAAADPHADRYSYLTWEDVAELENSGRVEIGCHTYNMHSVSGGGRRGCSKIQSESEEEYAQILKSDISLVQDEVAEHTGSLPIVFAYPFGCKSRESVPVLREEGFLITMLCREAPNYITRDPKCLYDLFRYNRSGCYSTQEFMSMAMSDK